MFNNLDRRGRFADSLSVSEESSEPKFASLQKQLEHIRFERALDVCESMADHRVLLTTTELARLNNILTGKNDDPWRIERTTVTLPSGRTETLDVLTNPRIWVREQLHHATELAENGSVIDAAVDIYVQLVLSHVFKDANRRSAAMAAHYFLNRYGVHVSGLALHELGLGDLREEGQIEILRDTIRQMAKFAAKRNQNKPE